jgi:hypothetical protein
MYNDDGNIITRRDVGVDTLVSSVAVWRKGLGVWFGEVGMISLTRHAFDDAGAYRLETAPGRGIPTPAASRVSVRYDVKFFALLCFERARSQFRHVEDSRGSSCAVTPERQSVAETERMLFVKKPHLV